MQTFNFRNMQSLLSKKTVTVLILFVLNISAYGQGQNKPFYDYGRKLHFGFVVGSSLSTFKYDFSDKWYHQDSIKTVSVGSVPGITLGAVADWHLGEYFDVRLIPSIVLSQRNMYYYFMNDVSVTKSVETALLEVPLLVKLKSVRHQNIRMYLIGGGKYGYDLASDYRAVRNPNQPKLAINPHNYNYEFGAGLDLYFPYFKFSPEIKLSKGINNILTPDNKIYSAIFDRFRSNFVFLSFYFEG